MSQICIYDNSCFEVCQAFTKIFLFMLILKNNGNNKIQKSEGIKMINVVICGDCGEKTLTRAIVNACTKYGGAIVCDGDKIYSTGKSQKYLIFSMCTLADLYLPDSIVVLGKALMQIQKSIKLDNTVCVLDSDNNSAIELLGGSDVPAVGCSMSEHDTLTVSGNTDDGTSLVSLRRNLRTSKGIIEPLDFILKTDSSFPIYPRLAAAAVLLLGGTDCINGFEF